jgi:hypothetical protein
LRVTYPDTFWGAISSSGVTEAIYDYWQYWEPIRLFGPQDCIHTTQDFVQIIDGILIDSESKELANSLKTTFGLGNLTDNTDFAATLANYGIGGWQGRNWDPEVSDTTFGRYCGNITSTKLLYPGNESLKPVVKNLTEASGHPASDTLTTQMLNWIGYVNATLVSTCAQNNQTQDQCYSNVNTTYFQQTDIGQQTWRSWAYQYCTEYAHHYCFIRI